MLKVTNYKVINVTKDVKVIVSFTLYKSWKRNSFGNQGYGYTIVSF